MNWYKKAINLTQITQITQLATQFRKQMVKYYDDESLKALCLPISRKLKEFLVSKGFNTAIVVQGVFKSR